MFLVHAYRVAGVVVACVCVCVSHERYTHQIYLAYIECIKSVTKHR